MDSEPTIQPLRSQNLYHSATSALLNLTTHTTSGFNQKHPPLRMAITALDHTKAFDTEDHIFLIQLLLNSSLYHQQAHRYKWLSTYIRDQKAYTTILSNRSMQSTIFILKPSSLVLCNLVNPHPTSVFYGILW